GRLSDRIGRRPVLLLSSLGLALSYVLWIFAQSFTLFAVSRVLGGLMAGNMGVASAAIADSTPPEKRTQSMGLVGAAFGLGMLLGPMIGGLLALVPVDGLVGSLPGLHTFSIAAGGAFLIALLSAALNAAYLSETLSVEHRREHPWIENPVTVARRNFRQPVYFLILNLNLLYLICFSAFEFGFSFFYKLDFGLQPAQIGLVFFYIGIVLVLGQGGLVRVLAKRMHSKKILITGLVLMPLPLALFAWTAPYVWLSLLALLPVILGAALFQPGISGLLSLHTPPDRQGLALSTLRSFGSLGRALGPILGAALYWYAGIQTAYLVIAIVLAFLTIWSFFLKQEPQSNAG
ncbi:MAG: MFS transporter, partial [Leptospiraceae bacterium]|nr:MFS transporter [Leptospiraceae bacterium]